MTNTGVDVDFDQLASICERYGVARLDVFGSVARGEEGPGSDLDLLYELAPGARLGWEIEDLSVRGRCLIYHGGLVASRCCRLLPTLTATGSHGSAGESSLVAWRSEPALPAEPGGGLSTGCHSHGVTWPVASGASRSAAT